MPALALAVRAGDALGPLVWQRMQRTHSFQPGHLAAAAELRARRASTAETTVMSRYPAIAFHAGTRWTPTPCRRPGRKSRPTPAAHGADYLVMDGWEAELRPVYGFLLTSSLAPRRSALRHDHRCQRSTRSLIYKFP